MHRRSACRGANGDLVERHSRIVAEHGAEFLGGARQRFKRNDSSVRKTMSRNERKLAAVGADIHDRFELKRLEQPPMFDGGRHTSAHDAARKSRWASTLRSLRNFWTTLAGMTGVLVVSTAIRGRLENRRKMQRKSPSDSVAKAEVASVRR